MLTDPQMYRTSTIYYLQPVGAALYHHIVLPSRSIINIFFCTEKYEGITEVDIRTNGII
jgi:hypothetical protein